MVSGLEQPHILAMLAIFLNHKAKKIQNHSPIDFNMGTKLFEKSAGGSLHMMSRRSHCGQDRCPVDDFESFLYFACVIGGVHLEWFHDKKIPYHHATRFFCCYFN